MATDRHQLHLWLDAEHKRQFHQWCIQHDLSMSEVGRLLIEAVLDNRIDVDKLQGDKTDDRQSTDQTS